MLLKHILLKTSKFILYILVVAASCGMGVGINYLYSELSGWFLFFILAAITIAMALLFGVRIIINDRINPSLEK